MRASYLAEERGKVGIAEALQADRDGFPNPPARIGGEPTEIREHRCHGRAWSQGARVAVGSVASRVDGRDTRGMRRVAAAVAFVVLGLVSVGVVAGCGGGDEAGTNPSDPHVAMGAHVFVQFACSACHGEQGQGGVSGDVPALTDVGRALTVAQLTKIINSGLGESTNPQKPYMPVWGLCQWRARAPVVARLLGASID